MNSNRKLTGFAAFLLMAFSMMIPPFCFGQATQPDAGGGAAKHSPKDSLKDSKVTDDSAPRQAADATGAETASSEPETGTPVPGQATQKAGAVTPSGFARRANEVVRNGPYRDTFLTIDLADKYVKAVVGGFQQGAVIGLGLQFSTAELIKPVEFRALLLTSPLLYRRFEGEAYIPKVFSENTHADVWFDYLRRTKDNFFGIGPRTPHTSLTDFDVEQRSFNAILYHNFTHRFQLGGYVSLTNSSTYPGQSDRHVPTTDVFSGNPNVIPITLWAPGLQQNTKILSYGGFAEWDLRNNSAGLTKGAYFYARAGSAQGLKVRNLFSDYGWLEGVFDARGYLPLGSNWTSLAVRGAAWLEEPRGNSQIPFYDLAFLGGRMYDRGFQNFRFRGNNLALFSAELRQTVWRQREDRGLDVVGFGDIGQVWGDNRSRIDPVVVANNSYNSSNWRSAVGGGIQYRYNKSFAARIDIGHSNERTLIFLSLTRGF